MVSPPHFAALSDDTSTLRLVNGPHRCSGRVEVFHNQQWGTVCDDGWDMNDAMVVCNQLGCGEALSATTQASFGRGADPIWLDRVACTGRENTLIQCRARPWGVNVCTHEEDAGVVCSGNRVLSLQMDQAPSCKLRFGNSNKGKLANNSCVQDFSDW